jgi:hypothetical protein
MRVQGSGLVFFATTNEDFPSIVVFGSEAAAVPGLLTGDCASQKSVAKLLVVLLIPHFHPHVPPELRAGFSLIATDSLPAIDEVEEGGLQSQSIVLLKRLSSRSG